MKTQKIYGVPKGVTEIHIDEGLRYGLYTKDGEPEFISISQPDAEEKAPTQFAYDAACTALHKHRDRCEQLEAELAESNSEVERLRKLLYVSVSCGEISIEECEKLKARLAALGDQS